MAEAPRCDTCGKPYVEGDAMYTIANKFDDGDNWISFRHWKCNEEDGPFAQLKKSVDRLRAAANKLREEEGQK